MRAIGSVTFGTMVVEGAWHSEQFKVKESLPRNPRKNTEKFLVRLLFLVDSVDSVAKGF
jgi:hypothetical protein